MAVDVTQPVFPPTTRTPITSQWGGAVSEGVIQRFTSEADRDAKWISPPKGAHCVTIDSDYPRVWVYNGAQWISRNPLGVLDHYINTSTNTDSIATSWTKLNLMNVQWTAINGRLYRLTTHVRIVHSSTGLVSIGFGASSGNSPNLSASTNYVGQGDGMDSAALFTGAGAQDISVLAFSNSGDIHHRPQTGHPSWIAVEDIGPI